MTLRGIDNPYDLFPESYPRMSLSEVQSEFAWIPAKPCGMTE